VDVNVASLLMSEVKALLIGQSVEPQVRKELRELLAEYEHIAHSPYLTLQTGGDEALLAINVRYSGYDSVEEVQEAKEHLRAEIKKRFPIFTDIYIDASLEEN
jgi:divalent metal cation (Fe/Co/Zn/Cd) transporter